MSRQATHHVPFATAPAPVEEHFGKSQPIPADDEKLYALAVEQGRARIPSLLHFHAKDPGEARAYLVRLCSTGGFPPRSKIVSQGPAIGALCDDNGENLIL